MPVSTTRRRVTLLLGGLAFGVASANASAGDFFERDGLALDGHDAVAYFTEGKPVRGRAEHRAAYRGSTFQFASAANRAAFVADPAKYAPQYGGFCAFGVAGGYKAKSAPDAFSVVDGKLYLNYDRNVQRQWRRDVPGYVGKAERNWPEVARQTKVIP